MAILEEITNSIWNTTPRNWPDSDGWWWMRLRKGTPEIVKSVQVGETTFVIEMLDCDIYQVSRSSMDQAGIKDPEFIKVQEECPFDD